MKIMFKTTFSKKDLTSLLLKRVVFLACLLFVSIITIQAQQKTITGVVTDDFNEPMIGVTVRIQNTTTGTLTDLDGVYSLSVNSGDVIEFSFIGMKPQTVKVGNQTTLNMKMEENALMLKETVVIGYGSARKVDLTGSIASVSSDEILKHPSQNAVQAVQGKIAGVNITTSDAPGSTPSIAVRGLGTALGGRDPLYIVDGFPVSDIRNISPTDILTMNVLKDASSASIYGMRAANGVVIITTKKGEEGTSKISVESFVGIKNTLNRVKMANSAQYVEYYNENIDALRKYYTGNDDPMTLYPRIASADQQAYDTDWYDELVKTGFFTNTAVSVSGGSKSIDYFLSYNYYKENGVLEGQDYNRTTIRNNNNYKLFNDRLIFRQNASLSFSNERPKPMGAFNDAYKQSPLTPKHYDFYNADGTLNYTRFGRSNYNKQTGIVGLDHDPSKGEALGQLNSIGNPLQSVALNNQKNKRLVIQGGLEGEFKITDFLKVNTRIGATKQIFDEKELSYIKEGWLNLNPLELEDEFIRLKNESPNAESFANNKLRLKKDEGFKWTWEAFATFHKSFDKHNVEAVVGTSREKDNIGSLTGMSGFDVPSQSQYWSIAHSSRNYPSAVEQYFKTPTALASYFGRLQYNFDGKYYLSATVRRDGSSVFVTDNKYWGTFPSVGLGWNISEESFLKDVDFIDHLKVRGNWGKLGNQNVPRNIASILTKVHAAGNMNYVLGDDQVFIGGAHFGSPALPVSWEVTEEWGIGTDYSVLGQRLSGSIDYYNKRNTNMLLDVPPLSNSAFSENYYDHAGEVTNKGFEFELSWSDKLANGLQYTVSANYSYNKNEVNSVQSTYTGTTGGSMNDGQITKRLQVGQPIYAWWMFEADGIWQNETEIADNAHIGGALPGHVRYKDQNGDGIIDDRDKIFAGSYIPTSNFGLQIALEYKNIDLSIAGYGVAGNKVYNGLKHGRINGGENISYDTYKNRWTGEGSTNEYAGANRDTKSSTYFLENGSYFRINNITLGYTFRNLIAKGTSIRAYATAQNPFIFTGYSGFSPEITTNDGNPRETTGIELSAYPSMRSFVFGVNLQF